MTLACMMNMVWSNTVVTREKWERIDMYDKQLLPFVTWRYVIYMSMSFIIIILVISWLESIYLQVKRVLFQEKYGKIQYRSEEISFGTNGSHYWEPWNRSNLSGQKNGRRNASDDSQLLPTLPTTRCGAGVASALGLQLFNYSSSEHAGASNPGQRRWSMENGPWNSWRPSSPCWRSSWGAEQWHIQERCSQGYLKSRENSNIHRQPA